MTWQYIAIFELVLSCQGDTSDNLQTNLYGWEQREAGRARDHRAPS